jgi:superfamily II DNA or RNA helicase
MLQLRDYQQKAVHDIRESFLKKSRSPLLVLPTGGGKTVVFSYIAATTAARGKRVLILVHRIELLRQTSEALRKSGVRHGLVNPKFTPDLSAPVQVASVQTIIKRLHLFKSFDLIVVDEAHHALATTWKRIIDHYSMARVLGVTATPCRADGTGLGIEAGGVFDDIIIGPQVSDLIAKGFLVKPVIYAPAERLDLSGLRTKMGDYDNAQLENLMDKPTITGDAVSHYKKLCDGVPAVAFCVSVRHAQHVAEEFRRAGYRAYHADGSLDDDVRKRILNGLGNGTVDVVTSCDLISEGTDIPAIGAAILLRPTQSLGLYLQQVGRALRPCAGKERAVILDHVGNVLTHGLPDEIREWSLEGEQRKNKKKEDKEKAIQVKQCEKCYAIHEPAPICPVCGHIYEVKENAPQQVDGELRELSADDRLRLKKAKITEQARAQSLEELERIASQRGYKPGWAKHIWASRQNKQTS